MSEDVSVHPGSHAPFSVKLEAQRAVRYLKADCGVRYWDDAEVNGVQDNERDPRMPLRTGESWAPLIDLETGRIVGWPEGVSAETHYKVCDAGLYSLLDADQNEVVRISGYVPKMMCPGGNGFGDYVIMSIGPDGAIKDWRVDLREFATDDGKVRFR